MAFDPNKYKVLTSEKFMSVVFLIDVSGSMDGDLYGNRQDDWDFHQEGKKEIPYKVAIITFGASVDYHTPYTAAGSNMPKNFASEDAEKIFGTDKLCLKSEYAANIVKIFKRISISVSSSVDANKKDVP